MDDFLVKRDDIRECRVAEVGGARGPRRTPHHVFSLDARAKSGSGFRPLAGGRAAEACGHAAPSDCSHCLHGP
jgi:hypothetical protein